MGYLFYSKERLERERESQMMIILNNMPDLVKLPNQFSVHYELLSEYTVISENIQKCTWSVDIIQHSKLAIPYVY